MSTGSAVPNLLRIRVLFVLRPQAYEPVELVSTRKKGCWFIDVYPFHHPQPDRTAPEFQFMAMGDFRLGVVTERVSPFPTFL